MKRCRTCRREFVPTHSTTQMTCSPTCAIAYARNQPKQVAKVAAKLVSQEKREWRKKTKSIGALLREAQHEFNAFIRLRDHGRPCISCGRLTGAKLNAGHYRTTKAASHLRFNEDNVHAQCEHCNSYLSGNLIEYRKGLIGRIGVERVEALENDSRTVKWDRDELIALRRKYLGMWKALVAEREAKCLT